MKYILSRHSPQSVQFIDGWTGKGVIYRELKKEISSFEGVSDNLAVLADPAYITELCGTHDDIMIPSSCLNCRVCGLISRTFLRTDIIGERNFHGAAYYGELASQDRTYEFIDSIVSKFRLDVEPVSESLRCEAGNDVSMLSKKHQIKNINYIKPGIGETTRVLLRRVPWKVVVDERYRDDPELAHIFQLAQEKDVEIELDRLENYKCCGLIKQLSDV